jgi:prevent-host-death family protein
MKKIGVADLKAHLSEHLRAVRGGGEVIVMDGDTPVARIVPYETSSSLRVRKPVVRYANMGEIPLPPSLKLDFDPAEDLLNDRNSGGERHAPVARRASIASSQT